MLRKAGALSMYPCRRCWAAKRKLAVVSDHRRDSILELNKVVLGYPESTDKHVGPLSLSISHPSTGGHVLLGKNGSGKSLIAYTLASLVDENEASTYVRSGTFATEDNWHKRAIAKVSFQSHEQLLTNGGTVSKAISDGANLSKAAKFLIVRFGLYHHLHREVKTLSTGEIRKVMLIRALANRPRLLILDNAFDGLDVATRETLKELVSRTIQGFRPDILVQAVSAKATAHTQVLLMTNRAEEIVNDIQHVTILRDGSLTTAPRNRRSGEALLQKALGLESSAVGLGDMPLPSLSEIRECWHRNKEIFSSGTHVINANALHFEKGEAILLKSLDWSVKHGERWLIAGRNGAGKSTLGRLLAKHDAAVSLNHLTVLSEDYRLDRRRHRVGWCSTELHLHLTLAKQGLTVKDIFEQEGSTGTNSLGMTNKVLAWLGIDDQSFLSQSFSDLSQGQQKLVLIGAAIACRPDILVMDEITQGLDAINRDRVLQLLELICEATDVTLVYITHHLEEILPSITHILHLVRGDTVYNGEVQGYDEQAAKSLEELDATA